MGHFMSELKATKYNSKLNRGTCFYIGMNGIANIPFKDSKKIPKADQVIYLGGIITCNASRNADIWQDEQSTCNMPKTQDILEKIHTHLCLGKFKCTMLLLCRS